MTFKTVTIFGASGKAGRLVVAEALARGFNVTAFVHSHPNLEQHPRLSIVKGDIHNAADVQKALTRADAVVSTLGSWGTKHKDILTSAMEHIIPAMQENGIDRIVSLTGAEARATGDDLTIIHKLSHVMIRLIGGNVLRDGESHIGLLEQSGLDWAVIRSPVMRSRDVTVFSLTDVRPMPWVTISRKSVAAAMLAELGDNHHSQRALFIK